MSLTSSKRDGRVKDKKCAKRAQEEKQAVQQRTFTKWINMHLKRCDPPLQVNNLFTDVQDGKVLMALLEELSGCNMLDRFRPFPHHIFRLNNIAKVLNFLEDRNVSLINIDANDIADGNPSVVLRLIWNIIVYYQIKQVTGHLEKFPSTFSLLSLPCGSDSSGRSSPVSPGDDIFGTPPSKGKRSLQNLKYRGTAIKTLLSWVQNCTAKYGVEIHDFGNSWRSGMAFLALVKFFCPEFVDMRKALSSEPRLNMETAFTAAYEWLGIPPLLDPDDVAVYSPDEQSVITYVAQFLECWPGHGEDSASTDSSRGTPNSIERWDRPWIDSVSCVSQSNVSAEALRRLQNPSETCQEEQDQVLGSESLPICPSDNPVGLAIPQHFLTMKSSSWSTGQSFSDSTGGQCCDSVAWKKGLMVNLEDDGNSSEVSKAVYAMSMLDSDEEDAYSYILELDNKEAGMVSNVNFEFITVMDAQGTEFDINVVSTLESQGSERNALCNLCDAQSQLKPTNALMSCDSKGTDESTLRQVKDINVSQRDRDSLSMNQTGIDNTYKTARSSADERLDLDCSFKMKESIYSDVFTLTCSDGVDHVQVDNDLNKEKIREDLFLCELHDSLSENDQYEQNRFLDQSVLDRITEEPAVSHLRNGGRDRTSYEMEELHVLLFLWVIAYCCLIYPHLDFFSRLSKN
ncbi:calmin [Rhinichthys klamathensis goyatoka]|uniref:calmin n=1 Tax=Rhinichthys klamathensis goyatoka TaxID=3034132 RepID=UPI0024B4FFD2|nr:calmin [Rhinichthys klamathensis goyatoka]